MRKLLLFSVFAVQLIFANAQNQISESTQVATTGNLSVSVTTSPNNGGYQPAHILAIWVQSSSTNTFTKTLVSYAQQRINELTNWVSNSSKNKVDAITGATLNAHATRTASWNGKNVSQVVVDDGDYNVKFELADGGSSKVVTYRFTKGTSSSTGTLVGNSASCFSNISVIWTPTNTAIHNIELSNLYSIYPNPAKASIYINGPDIRSTAIYTLEGKKIISVNQQIINIDALKKGVYMLNVNTGKGIVSKKLVKE